MSRRRKIETNSDTKEHNSNKGIALLLVMIIALAGVGAAATYLLMSQPSGGYIDAGEGVSSGGSGQTTGNNTGDGGSETSSTMETSINAELSVGYSPISSVNKKVIGELFVTTTCPYCAITEEDLRTLETQRNDLYFVSMVADKNQDAYRRYLEISQNQGTPDTEFDGGYRSELGAVDANNFINDIEACKNREMIPVEIQATVTSRTDSNAAISVKVTVGDENFKGSIKAFVIDKNSPWKNVNGESIPNAFVGYLLNEDISASGVQSGVNREWKMDGSKPFSELAVVIAVYDGSGYALQAYRIDL